MSNLNQPVTTDIAILDDDMDIRYMMQSILTFSGFNVIAFSTADQLYESISLAHPRLILMDMLLSGKDGREVCRDLKGRDNTKHIPIMMISAHPDAEQTCRLAGADEFLEKPFDIDVFINKAKSLLKE
jgi:DNA-binding response OmpR family regulator